MGVYLVGSAIQRLNNRDQMERLLAGYRFWMLVRLIYQRGGDSWSAAIQSQSKGKISLTFAWKLFMCAWQVNFSGIMFFFLFLQQLRTATGQLTSNNVASFFWTSPELLDGKSFGRNTDIWYYFFTNTVESLLTAPYQRRALLCPGQLFSFALAPLYNGHLSIAATIHKSAFQLPKWTSHTDRLKANNTQHDILTAPYSLVCCVFHRAQRSYLWPWFYC